MKFRRCLSALLIGSAVLAVGADAAEVWKVDSGRTSVHFYDNLLTDLGLRIDRVNETAATPTLGDVGMEGPYVSFEIGNDSDLQYQVNHGRYVPFGVIEGAVRHSGGFTITDIASGASRTLSDFAIAYDGLYTNAAPEFQRPYVLRDANGVALTLSHPGARFAGTELTIGAMTIDISADLAASLGRSDLANEPIGLALVEGVSRHVGGVSDTPDGGSNAGGGVLDVKLGELYGLRSYGHEGTYPNGASGLACATTSCNPGDVQVDWYAPMDERHPAIGMNLFSLTDEGSYNRFNQIGASWLKHGFFALSNNQCSDPRGCSGTDGTKLGIGCSDTYSAGLNADRYWLGPRDEWNPYTGVWVCNGSFFSGYQSDCVRREDGNGWGPTDHRLVVQDADLNVAGAEFFYDSYYIVKGEEVHFNNVGWRPVNATWSSGQNRWNFSDQSPSLTEGPALLQWGNIQDTVAPAGDGEFVVCSEATDLGGGLWRYEFAVYNFWSHKALSGYSVPVGAANITDLYFHDWDADGGNDWSSSVIAGSVAWSGAFPLDWGNQLNFGFTADSSPAIFMANLTTAREPGGETVAVQVELPSSGAVAVGDPSVTPGVAMLRAAIPNPVTKTAAIGFELSERANIALEIFSADGRLVKTLEQGAYSVGAHTATWDGTDLLNRNVAAGVYYYRLKVNGRLDAARSLVVVD